MVVGTVDGSDVNGKKGCQEPMLHSLSFLVRADLKGQFQDNGLCQGTGIKEQHEHGQRFGQFPSLTMNGDNHKDQHAQQDNHGNSNIFRFNFHDTRFARPRRKQDLGNGQPDQNVKNITLPIRDERQ